MSCVFQTIDPTPNILENARHCSVLDIRKYFVPGWLRNSISYQNTQGSLSVRMNCATRLRV
jgi:hypothetical protein